VLLFLPGQRRDDQAFDELQVGLPFLDVAIADQAAFNEFVDQVFSADRHDTPKGMIEVIL
jgi:hypothetical protein